MSLIFSLGAPSTVGNANNATLLIKPAPNPTFVGEKNKKGEIIRGPRPLGAVENLNENKASLRKNPTRFLTIYLCDKKRSRQ